MVDIYQKVIRSKLIKEKKRHKKHKKYCSCENYIKQTGGGRGGEAAAVAEAQLAFQVAAQAAAQAEAEAAQAEAEAAQVLATHRSRFIEEQRGVGRNQCIGCGERRWRWQFKFCNTCAIPVCRSCVRSNPITIHPIEWEGRRYEVYGSCRNCNP